MTRRRRAGNRVQPGIAQAIEGLEPRTLLSYAAVIAREQVVAAHNAELAAEAATGGTGVATPTPREAKQAAFVAKFAATYTVGPPQFTDEAQRITFHGVGGSNQTLHADALLAINTPADPSQSTTRATANLFGRDIATTGSDLILNLQAAPLGRTNGLPTHLTWTVNGNSAGTYAGATTPQDPNNPGSVLPGTLDIIYHPTKVGKNGVATSGTAILVFKGSIITTGVGNIGVAYGTTH